jgi:hypothetical protein
MEAKQAERHVSNFWDVIHLELNDSLKTHMSLTNRLSETIADFASKLGGVYEKFAGELKLLVKSFRRKNEELKKERYLGQGNFFSTWEAMVMEIEGEALSCLELASSLEQTVSQPMLEFAARKKAQYKKMFSYREQIDESVVKAQEVLQKRHKEYSEAWAKKKNLDRETLKENDVLRCHNAHNSYVLQLSGVNTMTSEIHEVTLPSVLADLSDVRLSMGLEMQANLTKQLNLLQQRFATVGQRFQQYEKALQLVDLKADIQNFVHSLKTSPLPPPEPKAFQNPDVSSIGVLHMSCHGSCHVACMWSTLSLYTLYSVCCLLSSHLFSHLSLHPPLALLYHRRIYLRSMGTLVLSPMLPI